MPVRKTAPKVTKAIVDDAPKPAATPTPVVYGATSGVMAQGKVGRAAREAAHKAFGGGGTPPEQTPDRPRDR